MIEQEFSQDIEDFYKKVVPKWFREEIKLANRIKRLKLNEYNKIWKLKDKLKKKEQMRLENENKTRTDKVR